jgi:hypothetical protein
MTRVVVTADLEVPVELLRRFEAVVIEERRSIALPDVLAECWQGCGGAPGEGLAAVKLQVRSSLKQGAAKALSDSWVGQRSVEPVQRRPLT